MNLSHRLADGSSVGFVNLRFLQLKYLNLIIPFFILVLSVYSAGPLFGEVWETGGLSIVFVPLLGPLLMEVFEKPNLILSSLVLIGYALGPVFFYLLVYAITKRNLTALLTSLLMLLPLIPIATLSPARLVHAIIENDGGHIAGLGLSAAALVLFFHFIRTADKKSLIFFLLIAMITGLISFFSILILFIFMTFVTVSEILIGQGKLKLKRFISAVFLLGVGLVVVYNISFLRFIFSEQGGASFTVLSNLIPMTFFLVPVLGIITFLIFDRRPVLQPLFLVCAFLITFGLLHFIGVVILESALFNQQRYTAEAEFAVNFFTAFVLTGIFDLLRVGVFVKRFALVYRLRNEIAFGSMITIILFLIGAILFIPHAV